LPWLAWQVRCTRYTYQEEGGAGICRTAPYPERRSGSTAGYEDSASTVRPGAPLAGARGPVAAGPRR